MTEKKEKRPDTTKSESIIVKLPETKVSETINTALPDSHQWISDCAYFKSLTRGYLPEYEVSDWLEAEKEYLSLISRQWKNGLVRLS